MNSIIKNPTVIKSDLKSIEDFIEWKGQVKLITFLVWCQFFWTLSRGKFESTVTDQLSKRFSYFNVDLENHSEQLEEVWSGERNFKKFLCYHFIITTNNFMI